MSTDGSIDVPASLALQNQTDPLTLKDRLIGRELYKDVDVQGTPDENGQVEVSTQRYSNFRPGLLNDLASGYRENYVTGFAAPNLGQQQTADGRQKGFGYRLGEGLGSVGRFIDSPLGRGLIAAGLNSALGYDNSLQEGLTAAVGRQNAQTADRVYRNQLKQMGFGEDELNNIRGNITSDMYKNLASNTYRFRNLDQNTYVKMKNAYDKQLQAGILTPEEYKTNIEALNNQYVNSQIQTMQAGNVQESNQTRNTNMNERLLPAKEYALYTAPQVALGNLGVAQGNLALNNARFAYQQFKDNFERNNPKIDGKVRLSMQDKTDALKQIQDLRDLVNNNPNATGLAIGSLAKGKELSQKIANSVSSDGQIRTRAGIAKLRGTTMHDLAGTAQTLQEQRNLAPFLPDATDDARTINAKLDQLEAEILREYNGIMNAYGFGTPQGMNTGNANATTNNEGWAF